MNLNNKSESKFSRIKDSIERGRMRPPSMDLHQLRKPSSFFKPNLFTRNKSSLNNLTENTKDLQLSTPKSFSSRSDDSFSINACPEIMTVNNFSPTKSINSNSSASISDTDQSPVKQPPIQFAVPIKSENVTKTDIKPSKFYKLKRRTLSMLFDQPANDNENDNIIIKTKSVDSLVRPKLPKTFSDGKQSIISDNIEIEEYPPQTQKELLRKRSRTLGSIENEIYFKRNNSSSLAKTLGNMMIRTRQNSLQSNDLNIYDEISNPVPEIDDNDSEETYIQKLITEGFENEICSILSEKSTEFLNNCLIKFINSKFDFKEEPLDIALRKFLMFCELPKETQQIDRVLSTFSSKYFSDNFNIWDNSDQIYFLTFSLVMLHTDHFNVNNKKKMTKLEFVKNSNVDNSDPILYSPIITKEILEYYYDNITFIKFIQKSKQIIQPPNIYSLPKRIFSSQSTTNLENLSNQTPSLPQQPQLNSRSYSLSSSTSQFFSSNQLDPYFHIIENDLDSLKLKLNEIKYENPFLNKSFESNYNIIKNNLIKSGGIYLRFNKNINWLTAKTETKYDEYYDDELNDNKTDENTNILKVIKIAEFYREETIKNSKFFTMVSTSKVIWKKCFGILTTCGLFIFDNLNFLSINDRERVLDEKNLNSFEEIIVDFNFDQILKSCTKLSINGLFAFPNENSNESESNFCFSVYSTNKKEIFSNSTKEEMLDWISSINYIAALDSCFLDSIEFENSEITSIRNITIEDKILKLSKNLPSLNKKISETNKLQNHLKILTPFQVKTKENLIHYAKILEKRLDWLWYEISRNEVYVDTLQKELLNNEYRDRISVRIDNNNDNESFLENSFINDDYLNNNNISNLKNEFSPSKNSNFLKHVLTRNEDEDEYFDAVE